MAKDTKKKKYPIKKQKAKGFPKPDDEREPAAPVEDAPEPEEAEDAPPADDGAQSSGISKKTEEEEENERVEASAKLNKEIDDNFKLAWEAERDWISEAKEDIEFKAGKQWSEEDKAKLKDQARPCLTFNKIKAIVKLLTGHFIQNSARIQVSPEGGEDQKFSDVADRVLNHVDEHAQLEFNMGYLFGGGETTGRGHIELHIDYEKDPIFGHLRSIYHGKPGTILMDPRGTAYDLNQDREFGFKIVKKNKSELKALYPDKESVIDGINMDTENPMVSAGQEGDANNYGQDKRSTTIGVNKVAGDAMQNPETGQWHVKEYWRVKRVKKWYAYFVSDGSMPEFATKPEAEAEVEKRKAAYLADGGLPDQWATQVRERQRKEMHVAIRCGGEVLADGKSPFEPNYSGFPFFQFIADWTPEAENMVYMIQGIVRSLKDPQREKNKARSQFLHIINTAANAGWIIDADAMDPSQKDELKNFGATPGIVIQKKAGSAVTRIEPTPAPVAQQIREKAANDDFTEVSGVNTDLLALDESANPSGKAIALRIRQGLTILEPDFRNFRYTKKLLGTAVMQMAPTLFDVAKLKKVLGENFLKQNALDDTFLKAFLVLIEDLRYNVRIAERGDTKTMREETFEDMMQMLQNGIQFPFEVLAEFMTLPNKAEVIKKVKEFQAQQAAIAQAAGAAGPGVPARA